MHYYKAIRLLLQPFLTILPPTDPHVALCLHAAGQISQLFKRLQLNFSYGHSFVGIQSVFIAGLTMCYCLFISPDFWTITVSNDLRACSSALFVMAERTPSIAKYRDALENVITATMEFLAKPKSQQDSVSQPPHQSHADIPTTSPNFSGVAQESYVRGSPAKPQEQQYASTPGPNCEVYEFVPTPTANGSPGAPGRFEGRQGEMGQMDAEWLLGLCEGDGFSLQALDDMMRFEPSLGAWGVSTSGGCDGVFLIEENNQTA